MRETGESPDAGSTDRYGPIGFLAATANILVLEFVTWVTVPLVVVALYFALPLFLIDLIVSAALAKAPRKTGQVGRGMLIGCIAAPLTLLIFVPGYVIIAG